MDCVHDSSLRYYVSTVSVNVSVEGACYHSVKQCLKPFVLVKIDPISNYVRTAIKLKILLFIIHVVLIKKTAAIYRAIQCTKYYIIKNIFDWAGYSKVVLLTWKTLAILVAVLLLPILVTIELSQ